METFPEPVATAEIVIEIILRRDPETGEWKTNRKWYEINSSNQRALIVTEPMVDGVEMFVAILGRGGIPTRRFILRNDSPPIDLAYLYNGSLNGNSYQFVVFCQSVRREESGVATSSDLPEFIVRKPN